MYYCSENADNCVKVVRVLNKIVPVYYFYRKSVCYIETVHIFRIREGVVCFISKIYQCELIHECYLRKTRKLLCSFNIYRRGV